MEQRKNNTGHGHRTNNHSSQNREQKIHKIEKPLHIYYADKSKLFLPDGKAYKIALSFKGIATHQLRKILNQVKLCIQELGNKDADFNDVKNQLFMLLPLSAYNGGRDSNLKKIYRFLVEHLNENSITCEKDIEAFDELFTSVVAYHKYLGGK